MSRVVVPMKQKRLPEQLDLFQLAELINAEHDAAVAAIGEAAGHAMKTGQLLLQAQIKVQVEGIGWIAWVEANLKFGRVQASSYLRIAKDASPALNDKRAYHSTSGGSKSLRASLRALIAPADDVGGGEAERQSRGDVDEFSTSGAIAKITHVIATTLNDWPEDQNAKLEDLSERLERFIQKIAKRLGK